MCIYLYCDSLWLLYSEQTQVAPSTALDTKRHQPVLCAERSSTVMCGFKNRAQCAATEKESEGPDIPRLPRALIQVRTLRFSASPGRGGLGAPLTYRLQCVIDWKRLLVSLFKTAASAGKGKTPWKSPGMRDRKSETEIDKPPRSETTGR